MFFGSLALTLACLVGLVGSLACLGGRPAFSCLLVAPALVVSLIVLVFGTRISVQFDRVFEGIFDGPEGHAVLLLYPTHLVSLLVR